MHGILMSNFLLKILHFTRVCDFWNFVNLTNWVFQKFCILIGLSLFTYLKAHVCNRFHNNKINKLIYMIISFKVSCAYCSVILLYLKLNYILDHENMLI